MAGRKAVRTEIARQSEQVGEFGAGVALNAGDRRLTGEIGVGEGIDHRLAESAFMVEDVMRDAQPVAHRACVANVAARAAAARAPRRLAMIVKLQGHADRLGAGARGERRHHRTVDAARHGNDDAPRGQGGGQLEIRVVHNGLPIRDGGGTAK